MILIQQTLFLCSVGFSAKFCGGVKSVQARAVLRRGQVSFVERTERYILWYVDVGFNEVPSQQCVAQFQHTMASTS